MALLGEGVLAIWNGIAGGRDAEFLEWHVKEHMPERVAVPGFLRGRRYTAIDGSPAYFNFYEVTEPGVLISPAYLERLDNPSPWTRKVVSSFVDTSRTICRVACSAGRGVAPVVEVLRFGEPADTEAFERGWADMLATLTDAQGVTAAHLFLRAEAAAADSAESRLRDRPDTTWGAIVAVETVSDDAVAWLRREALAARSLESRGLAPPAHSGAYRLDFCLDAAEPGLPHA